MNVLAQVSPYCQQDCGGWHFEYLIPFAIGAAWVFVTWLLFRWAHRLTEFDRFYNFANLALAVWIGLPIAFTFMDLTIARALVGK